MFGPVNLAWSVKWLGGPELGPDDNIIPQCAIAALDNDLPSTRADTMACCGVADNGLWRERMRFVIAEMTEPRLVELVKAGMLT